MNQTITTTMAFIITLAPLQTMAQPMPLPPSKASKPTIADGVPIYYYNGDSKVDLLLATDELDVVTEPSALPVEAELRSVSDKVSTLDSGKRAGNSRVKLSGIKSRNELAQEAHKLKKNPRVKGVRAVAYRRGAASKDDHSRQTIGNQFSLKLAPGQSIDSIKTRHGLKIVQ